MKFIFQFILISTILFFNAIAKHLIKTKIYILAYLIFICLTISGCSNQYEIKSENQKKGLIKSIPDWYVDSNKRIANGCMKLQLAYLQILSLEKEKLHF